MSIKHWNYLLTILIFVFISCESDKNEPKINEESLYPVGEKYTVSLNFTPFLEVEEQPLGRATSTLPSGLYAVNVSWKGKSLNYFQPYASGLFDDPTKVEIGLIEGYTYRFDCSFLNMKEAPHSITINDTLRYGLPFSCTPKKGIDGWIGNDLRVSINSLNSNNSFYQHIYKGDMHMKEDSISTHPTVKRFFGSQQLDFSNAGTPISVSITLKPTYYSVQFATSGLAPGDSIKIVAKDIAPLYLLYSNGGTSMTEERTISMYDLSDYGSAKVKEEEQVAFTIAYRRANDNSWYIIYSDQKIQMKRYKKNKVNIVNIDKNIGETAFSFEQSGEMEEIVEQEIGNDPSHKN